MRLLGTIAARANAKTSASAFSKEQNNEGLEKTVSVVPGSSNNYVDMCGDGDESDCTFHDSGARNHHRKPSSQYQSELWQYYLEFDLFKYLDNNGIVGCNCCGGSNGAGDCGVELKIAEETSVLRRHIEHRPYDIFRRHMNSPDGSSPPLSYPPGYIRAQSRCTTLPLSCYGFQPEDSIDIYKQRLLSRALYIFWKKKMPFTLFVEPALRILFQPFSRDADVSSRPPMQFQFVVDFLSLEK